LKYSKIGVFLLSVSAAWAQLAGTGGRYSGPSVLSRAGGALGRAAGQPLAFRFFASAAGEYSTDLRDVIGLDYRGSYHAYGGRRSNFNGMNHYLALDYARQLSARTQFYFTQGAATYSHPYGGLYTPVMSNPMVSVSDPVDEGFDARTYTFTTSSGFLHMLSRRWQVSGGGTGFIVRRHSRALLDTHGWMGDGAVTYLLGPHKQIGGAYRYSQFRFPGGFGKTNVHTAYLTYAQQIGPLWTFSLGAGGFQAQTDRLASVRLDPLLAAIIGQPTTLQQFHHRFRGTAIRATLGRQFRRSSLSFYYNRGATPGNGFLATSQRDQAGMNYSYLATEKLNVGFNAAYHRYKALTQTIGAVESYGAGIGLNYRLTGSLYFTTQARIYRFSVADSDFDRDRLHLSLGISWSPGELPLSLW